MADQQQHRSNVRVPDLNLTITAGRLTRDPELKYTSGGMAYLKSAVATTRYWKDKSGQRQEETTFVDFTLWGQQAEWAAENLMKGSPVIVEGRLRTNEWEDRQTGQKRSKLEVAAERVKPLEWGQSSDTRERAASPGNADTEPMPEDDIPF